MKKNVKKYSPKFFKDNLPEWKRKKDPFTTRIFYRPISFVVSSFATRLALSANDISYFSIIIAILSFVALLIPNHLCNIIGGALISVWLIMDCADGNIARSVHKQPFGEFADAISSYVLVAFIGVGLGIITYFQGGLFLKPNCVWIILIGAISSISDTLMRLVYQKYKNTERALADEGIISVEYDKRKDIEQTNSLIVRIESDFGISGLVPIITLLGIVFNCTDLVVAYYFLYYFMSSIAMIIKYIIKAISITNKVDKNNK